MLLSYIDVGRLVLGFSFQPSHALEEKQKYWGVAKSGEGTGL